MSRDIHRSVDAVWRIESARIVATLAKVTGDVGLAEELAQEALVEALEQWPRAGVPRNPGAWLTAVAKRRAIDAWRRRDALDERYRAIAHDLDEMTDAAWEPIDDDVLRLVFTACHPALSRESQVALTLRVVSGLTTEEIARMLLVPVATVQARITRAKKTLAAAHVPFETPEPAEWPARLAGVLGVVYLLFTEGYAATSGDRWIRAELANEALRLGRSLAALVPREAEAHALAQSVEQTDWEQVVILYEALGRLAPNPVVELNRAVAVSMATGPATALTIVDALAGEAAFRGSHLLPSVRGELLARLGRTEEARSELLTAAGLAANEREAVVLREKAAAL